MPSPKVVVPVVVAVVVLAGAVGYVRFEGGGSENGRRISLPDIDNLPDLSPARLKESAAIAEAQNLEPIGASTAGMAPAPGEPPPPGRAQEEAAAVTVEGAPPGEPQVAQPPAQGAEPPAKTARQEPLDLPGAGPVAAPPAGAPPAPAPKPAEQAAAPKPAPAPAGAPPAKPPGGQGETASAASGAEPPYDLRLTATARQVWVWISIDGRPAQAVSLDRGESADFKAEKGYVLTVDDAGGVEATLNGQSLPSFGQPAQARRDIEIPEKG